MNQQARARRIFLALWMCLTVIKVLVAAWLPLFVDEAFYWQEGQHLALAYSDLPGLTAWMTRFGTIIAGQHVLAIRLPFLLLGAALPWCLVAIGRRCFDDRAGWCAGTLALLMPLSASLGILAVPDVPLAMASLLCLDAGARLLRSINVAAALELALGLVIGALSHYRFGGVIVVGCIALLLLPSGRQVLRDARVWAALILGAAAWAPLIIWNVENAGAGLRFQLIDRNPWVFHSTGLWFLLIQAALVTPLLFYAMARAAVPVLGKPRGISDQWRYFGLLGALSVIGFFVLGFFADDERVSFHWPLPGYLSLLLIVPGVLQRWSRPLRGVTWAICGLGLSFVLGYYLIAAVPNWRSGLAASKFYPYNFAGWDVLAQAVREERGRHPGKTELLADNFKIGSELGFELGDGSIPVLDHPLNDKHGRAPQLRLWGLHRDGASQAAQLLVVGASEVRYKELLNRYHWLCARVGPLPSPRVVNIDHGRQRFLIFYLPAQGVAEAAPSVTGATGRSEPVCRAPAMAWIDVPASGVSVPGRFEVTGWAFKDGVGLKTVEVLLDGKPVAKANYGRPDPGVAEYWKISSDPNQPKVGFSAVVDATQLTSGRHWLGLRLYAADGAVEDWSEQPLELSIHQ